MRRQHFIIPLISFLTSVSVFAGGFEKNVLWSGKHAGIGGAAASSVEGADGILFNPAALADARNIDISVNASPTWSKFKAPLYTNNLSADSKRSMSPVVGLTAAYKVNEDLGIGLGYFVAGGSVANFGPQDFSATHGFTAFKPEYRTNLSITELSLGAGYKLMPGLSLGAAWRMSFVEAEYLTGTVSNLAMAAIRFTDLKDRQYSGFRVGMKYAPEDMPFGFGINVRSKVKFKAEGDVSGDISTAADKSLRSPLVGSKASMKNSFPLQIAVGAHYNVVENFRLHGEYVWSEYSANDNIEATGTLTTTAGATVFKGNTNTVVQKWKNQHNYRLAGEYTGLPWALRAGYVYTTAVVPEAWAKPTLSTPGVGHTVTAGTGSKFMDDALSFDAAFEYSWAKAKYETAKAGGNALLGKYESNVYALHLGVGYVF
jgi:long-chain fatty acid transport protein